MNKKLLTTLTIIGLLISPVFAEEQPAVQTDTKVQEKNIKKIPHKSFLSIFSRKKAEKRSTHPVVNEIPLYETDVVYDMDDCIQIGLSKSPFIKKLQDTKYIQKHNISSARSNYFPTFTGGAGYNYAKTNYSGGGINETFTTRNGFLFDVSLSEMIFDFGRTIAQINMNKYNYEAAGYELEDGILDTVFDIKVSYAAVLAARARRHVLIQNVKINQLNVERTKAMYEVGLKSKIDLVNAEGNLTNAEVSLLEGEKAYQAALIRLNAAMYYINAPVYSLKSTGTFNIDDNIEIKNEINVSYNPETYGDSADYSIRSGSIYQTGVQKRNIIDLYELHPFEMSLQESMDKAFEQRHDLKAMKMLRRAAEESLKAVKRSWYPQLNVSAGYTLGVDSKEIAETGYITNRGNLYAGLDFPIINIMYIKHQIDIAKLNVDKAQCDVDLMENSIYFEIQDLYITMKQLEKKIPLMKKRVDEFRENFELADGRYAVGLGDYIALQQAITDYNNSQLTFIEAVFLYNEARYELERAMAVAYKSPK